MNAFRRSLPVLVLSASALCAYAQEADLASAKEAIAKRDYAAAVKVLQPLADKSDPKAMTLLGKLRLNGQGLIKDESLAVELFRKAADAGDADAMCLLGQQQLTGNGLPKDEHKAVELFTKSAQLGSADGQFWYALSVYRGWGGLAADKPASVTWFRRAAEQGQSYAENWLGEFYSAGELVQKDPYQAISWYRKSALQMQPSGQRNLGAAYARGDGVARDDVEAFKWLLSAAYLREAVAMEWVGTFYERGRAVAADPVAAYMWYALALARDANRASAKTALERVADKLNRGQIAEAQAKLKAWPPSAEMARAILATDVTKATPGAPIAVATTTPPAAASAGKSGSGFVLGGSPAYVISNHHVIKDCKSIRIQPFDLAATVLAKDERNDLALLNVPNLHAPALKLRTGRSIRPGDELVTLGYPLAGLLASGASVNTGTLTNLGGLNNDTSEFQISVPVQPGNSGGPVLDLYGQVVGVVVAQINAVKVAQVIGTIPQNVNFAVNTGTLANFLEASNADYATSQLQADPKAKRLQAADVGSIARRSTVKVECKAE